MKIAFLTDNYMDGYRYLDPFRAELVKEFSRRSSEFLFIQCNDFMHPSGAFRNSSARKRVLKALSTLQRDLVFSLNRAGLTAEVQSVLRCPIYSWYIDNPTRLPKELRQHASQEKVFISGKRMATDLSLPDDQLNYLPFCSNVQVFYKAIQPVPESQICDVSFVGTLWNPGSFADRVNSKIRSDVDRIHFFKGFERYLKDYNMDLHEYFRGSEFSADLSAIEIKNHFDDFISSRLRLQVLDLLSDLKLEIYGTMTWAGPALLRSSNLLRAVRLEPVNTPQGLAKLYQRSRVGLSIAHHQAQSGFPIRIFDILSAGVPLVTDRHSEIGELFEENRAFLCYDTPEEASEKVRRVLNDPALARSMGAAAYEEIREKHTFKHRVDRILGNSTCLEPTKISVVSKFLDEDFLMEECGRSLATTQFSRDHRSWGSSAHKKVEAPQGPIALGLKAFSVAPFVVRKIILPALAWPIRSLCLIFGALRSSSDRKKRLNELQIVKDLAREVIHTNAELFERVNLKLRRRLEELAKKTAHESAD
jgi:glycosyltransferase involved in cell wall biosynthesis